MTERAYEEVLSSLNYIESHYLMIKEIKARVDLDPTYLKNLPDDVTTPGAAASILEVLGFTNQSIKLLQVARVGKVLKDIYAPDKKDIPSLFEGATPLNPLLNSKEIQNPSSAEIDEAIEEMKDLIVYMMKKIDDMLCDAKTKPYFAKFVVSVKAINMYSP